MLRFSRTALRVSTFSVYMKDLGRQGKLVGVSDPAKHASEGYKRLSTEEKKKLQQRANELSYPVLDAYNRFQKEYAHRFTHLPNKQRQQKVAELWAELKQKGMVRIPKAPKSTSRTTPRKPAAKKVKAAANHKKNASKAVKRVKTAKPAKKAGKK